jgi:hypothetical protein
MSRVTILNQSDFVGRGLASADIQASEWTTGNLNFLSAWLDAGRTGPVATPTAIDKRNGDLWSVVAGTPTIASSRPLLNSKPAWDFSGGGGVALQAATRVPTASWSVALVLEIASTLPGTGTQNLFSYFNSGALFGGLIRFNARKVQMLPNFNASSGSSLIHGSTLADGEHVIIISWDDVAKMAFIYVDTIDNVAFSSMSAVSSGQTSASRWRLGHNSLTANVYVGATLIFDAALSNYPYIVNRIFTDMNVDF